MGDREPKTKPDTPPKEVGVSGCLELQLARSLPKLGPERRRSVAMDLAMALVREGWIFPRHL